MAKQTKRTKEKRQGASGQAGVKVAQFFKKNIYVILMIVCILAIATMITVAVVLNNNNEGDPTLKPIVSGDEGNSGDNKPPVENPDDNKPPVENPDDNKPNPGEPEKKDFVMANPLDEFTFGQHFSDTEHVFNPTHNYWAIHDGLDFMAAEGSEVKCVFDGTVKEVTNDSYYGAVVTIEHQDGFVSVYKLLDGVTLKAGDKISQGDLIGKVSGTAMDEIASGAHLHLELFKDGAKINPMDYLVQGDK